MAYVAWSVVFGEQPSAAKWNILGSNDASFNDGTGIANLEFGSGKTAVKVSHKFRAYRNSAQNTSGGSYAKINFDSENFDTGNNFDSSTNYRFTAPVAGFYQFSGAVNLPTGGTTILILTLYKNGVEVSRGNQIANTATTNSNGAVVTDLLQLSSSDYVEAYVYCNGTVAITTGSVYTYMSGCLFSQT